MANNAANLVGARLLFGTMNNSEVFSQDSKARILGDDSNSIHIDTNALSVTGSTSIDGGLDVGGSINAPSGVVGNATTASRLRTPRTIAVDGDISGNTTFNGASNVTLSASVYRLRGILLTTTNSNPTGSSRLNLNGYFYATRVYNAVWNDIADFVEVDKDVPVIFGRGYIRDRNAGVSLPAKCAHPGVLGIASDTYGYGVGRDETKNQIPIAVAGFVLADVDEVYDPGTPLTINKGGQLSKAPLHIRVFHSERIVATFDRVEHEDTWNGIEVNGRSWVKVR